MPPFSRFKTITERPLFSQSRRPLAPGAAPPVDAPPVQKDLTFILKGIAFDDDGRRALILPDGSKELQRLEEGDEIGGWVLEKVEEESVIIRRGAESRKLVMNFEAPPPKPDPRKARREKRRKLLEQQKQQQQEQQEQPQRDQAGDEEQQ